MQRARIKFNENSIRYNKYFSVIQNSLNDDSKEEMCFAFFDDFEVVLYGSRSKFLGRMKIDEFEKLIDSGDVNILP